MLSQWLKGPKASLLLEIYYTHHWDFYCFLRNFLEFLLFERHFRAPFRGIKFPLKWTTQVFWHLEYLGTKTSDFIHTIGNVCAVLWRMCSNVEGFCSNLKMLNKYRRSSWPLRPSTLLTIALDITSRQPSTPHYSASITLMQDRNLRYWNVALRITWQPLHF